MARLGYDQTAVWRGRFEGGAIDLQGHREDETGHRVLSCGSLGLGSQRKTTS
jgi:hypothetical protein